MIYSEANLIHHVTSPINISEYISKINITPIPPSCLNKTTTTTTLNIQSSTEILSQELKKKNIVLFELGVTQGSHSVFG